VAVSGTGSIIGSANYDTPLDGIWRIVGKLKVVQQQIKVRETHQYLKEGTWKSKRN
jgi:hypothetical protein